MNVRPFWGLLLICLFIAADSPAQQTVFTNERPFLYKIPYHRHTPGIYVHGNTILREMAKVVLKEPWQVGIEVSGRLKLEIIRMDGADSLLIHAFPVAVSGDTKYRGFDIGTVLYPSRLNLELKWANRADTTGFVTQELKNLELDSGDSLVCGFPVGPFNGEVDTLMVSGIQLWYDSLAMSLFLQRLELIHNYHASLALLDSLKVLSGEIDLRDQAMLPVNYFRVNEITRALVRIRATEFFDTTLLLGHDPGRLAARLQDQFRVERTMTYDFLDELRKNVSIDWDGDTRKLASFFTGRTLSYIRRSHWMDNLQGSIYHDYLDHYFEEQPFPEGENVTMQLLRKMYPTALPDTLPGYFARSIYASMEESSKELITANRFAEAFDLMDFARTFAEHDPALKRFRHNEYLQRQAAEGIFNSYVGIAAGCIHSGKFGMADNYLGRADMYANANPHWVKADSVYRAVFSELFFLRNAECDRLLGQEKFNAALDCYSAFEDTYSSRDLEVVSGPLEEKKNLARRGLYTETTKLAATALKAKDSDSAVSYDERALALRKVIRGDASIFKEQDMLAPEIARIRYRTLVDEGTAALQKSQFTLALSLLKEARTLSWQFSIATAEGYDSIYRRAVKNNLLVRLSVSQKKIWANQFDSAQADLDRTNAAGRENGLSEDPDLQKAMNGFKNKIREQQCRNIKDSVDLSLIRADRGIALKNFPGAIRYFGVALSAMASDSLCGFDVNALKDSLALYLPPARYQENLAEINARIAMGNHSDAVKLLTENERLFASAGLQRFGLKPTDLFEFITDRNNPFLAESAAFMLQKDGRNREAFKYLGLLREFRASGEITTSLQADLGLALAASDHAAHTFENENIALGNYKVADEWYHVFRKNYIAEWKRLSAR